MTRADAWLLAWDQLGIHRTGTAGDKAGADWLAHEAASLGGAVSIETFPLSRVDPVSCWIECDGQRIEGVPVFDLPPTGPAGVNGPIGVVSLSPWAVYTPDYRAMRRGSDHDGLVIVCQGAEPGLGLLNAERFREPYGCPAMHVAEMPRAKPERMVSFYRRTAVEACNVVVTIPGRRWSGRPVVVMTPRSSWWQSTSERGGGLVCWLETLAALIAEPPAGDVVFTANSGHELGHLGLDAFLERRPGWDRPDGAMWVHYGANIGAAGGKLSVQSADGPLRNAMRQALSAFGQPPDTMAPKTQLPSGETREIHRVGGRYITLAGTNRLFHLPQDRWPHSVDVPMIERVATAVGAMVHALTGLRREIGPRGPASLKSRRRRLTMLTIEPTGAILGATIRGLDAAARVSEGDFGQILAALGQYGVLRFPGQQLDEDSVRRFSQLFGDIQGPSSGALTKDGKEVPVVGILSNVKENGKYIGAADAGQDWHTDMSYRDVIGFVNVLYGIRIPRRDGKPLGGTEFSNMHAAYDALPDEIKIRLADATVTHAFEKFWEHMRQNKNSSRPPMTDEQRRRRPPVVHPLFLTHPLTGKRVLYCNPGYAIRINELPEAESAATLRYLYDHQLQTRFRHTHHWAENDLLVWDHIGTIHRAIADYRPDEIRLMRRCQVMATKVFNPDFSRLARAA